MAPDFTLPSNTGKDISLKDLVKSAKHTVLYFYPGGWPGFSEEQRGLGSREFQDFSACTSGGDRERGANDPLPCTVPPDKRSCNRSYAPGPEQMPWKPRYTV